jgi:hypothetical protein
VFHLRGANRPRSYGVPDVTSARLSHSLLAIVAVAAIAPAALLAQRADKRAEVPAAYKPPAGMCRIWVDAVPPDKQPAPTDCSAALKNKPTNGRVLFGESTASTRGGPPALMSRTLTPPIGGGLVPNPPGTSRANLPPARNPPKTGRDTTKTGHDSTVKKPPPPGR